MFRTPRTPALVLAAVLLTATLAAAPLPAMPEAPRALPAQGFSLSGLWAWAASWLTPTARSVSNASCDRGAGVDPNGTCVMAVVTSTSCDRSASVDPNGSCIP